MKGKTIHSLILIAFAIILEFGLGLHGFSMFCIGMSVGINIYGKDE